MRHQADTHAYDLDELPVHQRYAVETTSTLANGMGNLFTVYQTTLGVAGTSVGQRPNNISGVEQHRG